MTHTFASALILLILIFDPFGNIPVFANALKHTDPSKRYRVIIREHGIALVILLVFMFAGESFLSVLGLSNASLLLSGGVILFLIAIRMIFPPPAVAEADIVEPYIVPLAIPMIAGPSALATVLLLSNQHPDKLLTWIGALVAAICISASVLVAADKVQDRLGDRFVVAMEKLMGLILVAIAVEMLVRGIKEFLI
jgi:MarC family membrane protein